MLPSTAGGAMTTTSPREGSGLHLLHPVPASSNGQETPPKDW